MTRDGTTVLVELSDELNRATIGGREHAVRVVADDGRKVELEIDGEPVVLNGWPAPCPSPPGPVEVNGEAWAAAVASEGRSRIGRPAPPTAPAAKSVDTAPSLAAGEIAVVPPIPGRIVEVRVKEGETVRKGAVLLVLEAMKMRNEVTAPGGGVVRQLRVQEGANVRARETMLTIVPA